MSRRDAPDEGAFSFLPGVEPGVLREKIRGWEFLTTRHLLRTRRECADWTGSFLVNIHRDVFGKFFPEYAGRYRLGEAHYGDKAGPAPEKIDGLLQQVVLRIADHLTEVKQITEPLDTLQTAFLRAARDHAELIHIHPFVDGNGRWARIATAAFLFDCGFPIGTILKKANKRAYIDALDRAIEHGEPGDLANELLRGYVEAMRRRA